MKKTFLLLAFAFQFFNAQTAATIDNSFGTNGQTLYGINLTGPGYYRGYSGSGVLASDQKIFTIGNGQSGCSGNTNSTTNVVRFTENGLPDTTLGAGGYLPISWHATTSISASHDNNFFLYSGMQLKKIDINGNIDPQFSFTSTSSVKVKETPTNDILVMSSKNTGSGYYPTITKLDSSGNIVSSFGTNGSVELTTTTASFSRAIIDHDGNYLFIGHRGSYTVVIYKTDPNGNPILTFGNNGWYASANDTSSAFHLTTYLTPDNGVILINNSYVTYGSFPTFKLHVSKVGSNGKLSTAFTNGFRTLPVEFNPLDSFVKNNHFYIFGNGASSKYVLIKLDLNGNLVPMYANSPYVTIPMVDTIHRTGKVHVQGDKLVILENVESWYCSNSNWQYSLRRFFFDNSSLATGEQKALSHEVYPNPASDYLFIEDIKAQNISLYTADNRKLNVPSTLSDDKIKLDLSGLSKGIYFLNYRVNGKVTVKKIIKK